MISENKRSYINAAIMRYARRTMEANGLDSNGVNWATTTDKNTSALALTYKLPDAFELTADDKPEESGQKYYVTYEPLKAYTTIGAKNIHHAFNKATKEFKGKYTKLVKVRPNDRTPAEWEFLSVKEFGELLRKVPN